MTATKDKGGDHQDFCRLIHDPIFIVSSPRSGSTLLFDTLRQAPDLYTTGGESHRLIERIPKFAVPARGWASNRLTADDAKGEAVTMLVHSFYQSVRNRQGRPPEGPARLLEKTPKNSLRVPFFRAIWPSARFLFLYRDVRSTLASMIEAWQSGYFRTYPRLPGWSGPPWSLLLVPGWKELDGLPLPQIVAHQWQRAMAALLDDLTALPPGRVEAVDYQQFLDSPQEAVVAIARNLGFGWDVALQASLPNSPTTVSTPRPDKWRRIEDAIEEILPIVAETDARARRLLVACNRN